MTKKQKLLSLRERIIDEVYKKRWEEVWFFPKYPEVPGVNGFLGTDPIIFVSINPSFGTYPSKPDLFYYRNLKKQGFGNAHLTDLFKVKRKNESAKDLLNHKILLEEAERYITEEIKILQPKLIVYVGQSYKKDYERFFQKFHMSTDIIPHYAPQFNNKTKQKKFRKALREIRNKYLLILRK